MYLLPIDQYDRLISNSPTDDKLNELDKKLKDIIYREDLSEESKANLYQQTLQKYLGYKHQVVQEKMSEKQKMEDLKEVKKEIVVEPLSANIIVSSIAPSYKYKATKLLNSLPSFIKWDHEGQLVHKDETIPNSNIVDLVKGLVTSSKPARKKAEKLEGWKEITSSFSPNAQWMNY